MKKSVKIILIIVAILIIAGDIFRLPNLPNDQWKRKIDG